MNKFEWLAKLVSFDTTSRNSNLDLIQFVDKSLKIQGLETQIIHDPLEPKANLFAIIPDHTGNIKGGIIFSGHTDVVPVDGQQWSTDPFVATQLDGKIFGRGTCDMKAFIAVVLSLVPFFLTLKLARPIYLALSYDEETGCHGAPLMIDVIQQMNINPQGCLIGEPSNMKPIVAHKGKQTFRCIVHGLSAHSSLTSQACNAIEYAARIICFLRELANKYRLQGPFDQFFDVPFTTLTTNLIQGGNSFNTIPSRCEFIFEFRHLPAHDPFPIRKQIDEYIANVILPEMQHEYSSAQIVLEQLDAGPGFTVEENEDLTQLLRKLTQENKQLKVAYGTEAGLFQGASIPTIICGPGSIEQAHRENEYVTVEQLEQCEELIKKVVEEFCVKR